MQYRNGRLPQEPPPDCSRVDRGRIVPAIGPHLVFEETTARSNADWKWSSVMSLLSWCESTRLSSV